MRRSQNFAKTSPLLLSYVVPVKSKVKISQNLVAFSEYINFKGGLFPEHILMVYFVLYKGNLTNKH